MAGCVLRLFNLTEEPAWLVDALASSNSAVIISEADECFATQVKDAEEYLESNFEKLYELKCRSSELQWGLDFGVWQSEKLSQSYVLTPALVSFSGKLGMQLELTMYAATNS